MTPTGLPVGLPNASAPSSGDQMKLLVVLIALAQPCHIDGGLPDPQCSPGQATDATLKEICNRHTSTVRHVTDKTKRLICQMYDTPEDAIVEIDHIVPLELGGANSLINLWPQPDEPEPGYHQKDQLENRLHKLVCSGKMDLAEAQHEISTDWVALFYKLFPSEP
jgi:hypothetical protein